MNSFQQTRPIRRGPPKASRAAAQVFSKLAQATRFADPGLADNWPSIAGAETAALGRPGRVTGSGPGRTLEVIVRDGAAAAELQMRIDDLLTAVNRYLGPGAIGRITVLQRAGAARKATKSEDKHPADADADNPLGAALSSFRSAIRSKSRDE